MKNYLHFICLFLNVILIICYLNLSSCKQGFEVISEDVPMITVTDSSEQKNYLDKLLSWLPPDKVYLGRVSYFDETFQDWLNRTGELPPDFDLLPSIPFLPDPLIIDEGGKNIPVKTKEQWEAKREWMKRSLEYYITGTCPPAPDNLQYEILNESRNGESLIRSVKLTFGPDHKAELHLELFIPPGKGPFPVFLTQWVHREWAHVAVRRGYIGCIYAGSDANDDTEKYSEIWADEYDFTRLMRRAYGASRAIDYLYTLPYVDKDKIGMTGHSRNGKLSITAAAFDERIKACISSSGGSGAEVPWRYTSENYDIEDISLLACAQPSWYHPRLRFFTGRENKLPVDLNHYIALIAPRGFMLSTALTEGAGNPWGIEQVFHESKKVYKFLNAEDNLAIRSRYGLHSVSAKDMEDYIDFFDFIFKRSEHKPENRLYYPYSFESWQELSKEKINPHDYQSKDMNDILIDNQGALINSVDNWELKKEYIKDRISWLLGDEPSGIYNPGPRSLSKGGRGEVAFGSFLIRPGATDKMGVMAVSPYEGFGDQLFGYLYYPIDKDGALKGSNLPALIYLHEFDYAKGFNSYHRLESFIQSVVDLGYAFFIYDMIGFGNRIEEGTRFYNRYPHWSKAGKMVADARAAVDALENMEFIDSKKIYISGYSLGATIGLFSAALDERIAGVISVCGFTPMRLNTLDRGTEGIKAYSHLHGLIPRLGFFVGYENRIPVDFHEILASVAPKPILVIAPFYDKDAHPEDINQCIEESGKVFKLYDKSEKIQIFVPDDYNRFSEEMREKVYEWLRNEIL